MNTNTEHTAHRKVMRWTKQATHTDRKDRWTTAAIIHVVGMEEGGKDGDRDGMAVEMKMEMEVAIGMAMATGIQ